MKKRLLRVLIGFLLISSASSLFSQGFHFGIKGGPTVGFQRWDQLGERDPLYKYHGILFIESAPEDGLFSVFAQAGYHVRGSANRIRSQTVQTPTGFRDFEGRTIEFQFNNISVTAGGKQKYYLGASNTKVYYALGVRGDYNLSTNLPTFEEFNPFFLYQPRDEFVNKVTLGVYFGGGFEFPLSELVGMVLELSVNPDITRQYFQPPLENVLNPNPNSPNRVINLQQQSIRNFSLELTVGFRFWRKVEYID